MKKTPADELLIGAHTSIAGGVHKALLEGQEIGATTVQIFTSNQRQWAGRPIPEEEVKLWFKTLDETGLKKIMSHDSYLINLGSPSKESLHKSRKAFEQEIERCHLLKITYLNFHPGAALEGTVEECLDTISESLLEMEKLLAKGSTRVLLEATAGQGSSVGHRFEQLAYIIERVHKKVPVGVCIDTCHIFSAGYDIRTKKGWDETLKEFDRTVGLKHLYAFHVNDSMKPLASRRDRHEQLGKGEIGMECFKTMMTHPDMRDLPKYLETPLGPSAWKDEIQLLRDFAR
ncbi:MAG: deoxyribonuclease IV [Chlamydiales bacterium]|nr:deoxyribonuclease IV [Chlamydiales bacterium]